MKDHFRPYIYQECRLLPHLLLYSSSVETLIVGCGAAGLNAAAWLRKFGQDSLLLVADGLSFGTSRNTGSDKQTYYKLSLAGDAPDSVRAMADDLFSGGCVDGEHALCEAALSVRCFYHLADAGVPFPENEYGESVGYRTDHDLRGRASSAGPYTSRMMTEALFKEAEELGVPMLDGLQLVHIFVKNGHVSGALFFMYPDETQDPDFMYFLRISCQHLILATGGPAAMYRDSVYPASQTGADGAAFLAGIRGRNLTEWQFGMASVSPRWNVSGSYMQVLPRFISTDQDGNDPREFLNDYYQDPGLLLKHTFLKGYEWPFDSAKCAGGSSLIDLFVYEESVVRGRRVFLDYRNNPDCLLSAFTPGDTEQQKAALKNVLPDEAYAYLDTAGALSDSPVKRLRRLNEPAYQFFLTHQVDLEKELLEIRVCVQHNNGGLLVDEHWQTNIPGIYAVGEAACTHGIRRPGGSALNAGQVGSYRAAEHIAFTKDPKKSRKISLDDVRSVLKMARLSKDDNIDKFYAEAQARMSAAGGLIRSETSITKALAETDDLLSNYPERVHFRDPGRAGAFFRLYDVLASQKVYLSAMLDYIQEEKGSRGSALYYTEKGTCPHPALSDAYAFLPDSEENKTLTQETFLTEECCGTAWRKVHPIPDAGLFFETEWKNYRERRKI